MRSVRRTLGVRKSGPWIERAVDIALPCARCLDHVYDDIGRAVRAVARGHNQAYQAATGKSGVPAAAGKAGKAKR